jgi:hypothetical protein
MASLKNCSARLKRVKRRLQATTGCARIANTVRISTASTIKSPWRLEKEPLIQRAE